MEKQKLKKVSRSTKKLLKRPLRRERKVDSGIQFKLEYEEMVPFTREYRSDLRISEWVSGFYSALLQRYNVLANKIKQTIVNYYNL